MPKTKPARKPLAGSLGHTSNGFDHLPLMAIVLSPQARNALLLLEWEGESPASTGPLPYGPSVLHSAQKCAARENQPVGLEWVAALTHAAEKAWAA